jgi:hypothetical protein
MDAPRGNVSLTRDPRKVRTTGDGFQKLSGDLKRPYEPLDPPYRNDRSFKTLAIRARLGVRAASTDRGYLMSFHALPGWDSGNRISRWHRHFLGKQRDDR